MNTLRMIFSTLFVALFLTASLAYAAPSCCDPGSGATPGAGSFLPAPQFGGPSVAGPQQSAPLTPTVRRAVLPASAERQVSSPADVRYPAQGKLPRQIAAAAPSCCPTPQVNPAAAPGCCPAPQRMSAAPPACCATPAPGGPNQAQPVPGCGQFSGPECGMGCCGGGGATAGIYWPQTAQPIGNFTGGQVRSNVRPVPASAAAPRQGNGAAPVKGFGQPGYFGNVSPVSWSLY